VKGGHRSVLSASASTRPAIAIVHSSDELYGADRVTLQVAIALTEGLEADVEVWLPEEQQHPKHPLCELLADHGIAWRHVAMPVLRRSSINPSGSVALARRTRSFARLLRARPVDLVYCATSACLLAAPIARSSGVPRVVLHIQELWSGAEAHGLRLLARATTAQLAISAPVAEAAAGPGISPSIVENCVEEPPAVELTQSPTSRRPRYVVASRWNSWKGHATLAAAWSRAGCPGHLTVLGGPPMYGEAVDVPGLFGHNGIDQESVAIVGEVTDASPFIAAADALLLPSEAPEPFGLVVIEAFAAGRPVIASRAGGPLQVITEGVDGWFFEPGNQDDLADLLCRLSTSDLERAGAHARRTYERRYTPTDFRAKVVALVADELGERNKSDAVRGTTVPSRLRGRRVRSRLRLVQLRTRSAWQMYNRRARIQLDRGDRKVERAVRDHLRLPVVPPRAHTKGAIWGITMVKDEADIIEATIRHQLEQGVEAILVSDNGSTDGTLELLESLSKDLPVYIARDSLIAYEQSAKMTRLAHVAHAAGAGWIVPFDADEFWYGAMPSTLAETLAETSPTVVALRAPMFNLFPVGDLSQADGLECMSYRMCLMPHRLRKVVYRSHRAATLAVGNHSVVRGERIQDGLALLHLPWRSRSQVERKVKQGAKAYATAQQKGRTTVLHWRLASNASQTGIDTIWQGITAGWHDPRLGWTPTGPYAVVNPFERQQFAWQSLVSEGRDGWVPDDLVLGWATPHPVPL
jgi:glycosyltransferase involved in cell wall biosynthesis